MILAKRLTNTKQTGNGSFLDRKQMSFKFCIQECLDRDFCFTNLSKGNLRSFENFIKETVEKNLSITEVDKLFLRTQGHGSKYCEETIKGIKRQIFHYGKDRNPFRIHGYFNEDGYFVIHKIDPNHKVHRSK